jgi:hypothetical protein
MRQAEYQKASQGNLGRMIRGSTEIKMENFISG